MMLDFVKKLAEKMKREGTFEEKGYSFAIATYSNVAGKAIEQFFQYIFFTEWIWDYNAG